MTLEDLELSWAALRPPGTVDGISGRRAAGVPSDRPVYLAVDCSGRRHVLVQVPDETGPLNEVDTRSLRVSLARFTVGSNPESRYVDLVCMDHDQQATFTAIAQDLIRSISCSEGPSKEVVLGTLSRWRSFWSANAAGMSNEEALGLFGELWFLRRWLGPPGLATVSRWQVTETARHDFQWQTASVEVKTAVTQSTGAPVHHITSLDQLADPETGSLYLFSLQVCDDALAGNTLHRLVAAITEGLQGESHALTILLERLALRGYSPDDHRAPARPLRVVAERLYRVRNGFPRLLRSSFGRGGMPNGVVHVSYRLDLAACENWLVARQPQDAEALLV